MRATQPITVFPRFEDLASVHYREIERIARSMTGGAAIADDLVQDAFVAAFKGFDRYQPDRSFVAWMRAILRHRFLRYLRDRQRRELSYEPAALDSMLGDDPACVTAVSIGERNENLVILRECITELPAPMRQVVQLSYYEKMSSSQIGQQLGLSEGNVRQRLFRSREKLRKAMAPRLRKLAAAA